LKLFIIFFTDLTPIVKYSFIIFYYISKTNTKKNQKKQTLFYYLRLMSINEVYFACNFEQLVYLNRTERATS